MSNKEKVVCAEAVLEVQSHWCGQSHSTLSHHLSPTKAPAGQTQQGAGGQRVAWIRLEDAECDQGEQTE